METYRNHLPQLDGGLFLTDGGIETTLIFHEGLDLPHFAAFDLLGSDEGRAHLERYFRRHAAIAVKHRTGFVLESATWRASPDWAAKLGYGDRDLAAINLQAIDMLARLRDELASPETPMVVSGCVGPRGDGYDPGQLMTAEEAQAYHAFQISTFAKSEADQVSAITITNVPEAIGIARAAKAVGLPSVIAFTVETDGRLPTGESLKEAIEVVDWETGWAPAYYMINCAHTSHFEDALEGYAWMKRVRGLRANASRCSHAELDEAEELDDGDPVELGADYAAIRARFPWINVLGGCCGTDHRHIEEICKAAKCATAPALSATAAE